MGKAPEKSRDFEESMFTFTIQAIAPGLESTLIYATAYT